MWIWGKTSKRFVFSLNLNSFFSSTARISTLNWGLTYWKLWIFTKYSPFSLCLLLFYWESVEFGTFSIVWLWMNELPNKQNKSKAFDILHVKTELSSSATNCQMDCSTLFECKEIVITLKFKCCPNVLSNSSKYPY